MKLYPYQCNMTSYFDVISMVNNSQVGPIWGDVLHDCIYTQNLEQMSLSVWNEIDTKLSVVVCNNTRRTIVDRLYEQLTSRH